MIGRPRTPVSVQAGLATQRTALAWTRTTTGLLAIALLTARATLIYWPGAVAAAAIVVVAVAVVGALVVSAHRNVVLRRTRPTPLRLVRAWALGGAVVVVVLIGTLASVSAR
jgi:hypothetical protein